MRIVDAMKDIVIKSTHKIARTTRFKIIINRVKKKRWKKREDILLEFYEGQAKLKCDDGIVSLVSSEIEGMERNVMNLSMDYLELTIEHDCRMMGLDYKYVKGVVDLVFVRGFIAKLGHLDRDILDLVKVLKVSEDVFQHIGMSRKYRTKIYDGICFNACLSHSNMPTEIRECRVLLCKSVLSLNTEDRDVYKSIVEVSKSVNCINDLIERVSKNDIQLIISEAWASPDIAMLLSRHNICCLGRVNSKTLSKLSYALNCKIVDSIDKDVDLYKFVGVINHFKLVHYKTNSIAMLSIPFNFKGFTILLSMWKMKAEYINYIKNIIKMTLVRLQGVVEEWKLVEDLGGSILLGDPTEVVSSRTESAPFTPPRHQEITSEGNTGAGVSDIELPDRYRNGEESYRKYRFSGNSISSSLLSFSEYIDLRTGRVLNFPTKKRSVRSCKELRECARLECFRYYNKMDELCDKPGYEMIPIGNYRPGLYLSDFINHYREAIMSNECTSGCSEGFVLHELHYETFDSSIINKRVTISVDVLDVRNYKPIDGIAIAFCGDEVFKINDLTLGRFLHLVLFNKCYVCKCGNLLFSEHRFNIILDSSVIPLKVQDISIYNITPKFDSYFFNCSFDTIPLMRNSRLGRRRYKHRVAEIYSRVDEVDVNYEMDFYTPQYAKILPVETRYVDLKSNSFSHLAARSLNSKSMDIPPPGDTHLRDRQCKIKPPSLTGRHNYLPSVLHHFNTCDYVLSHSLRFVLGKISSIIEERADNLLNGSLERFVPCSCELNHLFEEHTDENSKWSMSMEYDTMERFLLIYNERSVFGVGLNARFRRLIETGIELGKCIDYCDFCKTPKYNNAADIDIMNWMYIFTDIIVGYEEKMRKLRIAVHFGSKLSKDLRSFYQSLCDAKLDMKNVYIQCLAYLVYIKYYCPKDPIYIFMIVECFIHAICTINHSLIYQYQTISHIEQIDNFMISEYDDSHIIVTHSLISDFVNFEKINLTDHATPSTIKSIPTHRTETYSLLSEQISINDLLHRDDSVSVVEFLGDEDYKIEQFINHSFNYAILHCNDGNNKEYCKFFAKICSNVRPSSVIIGNCTPLTQPKRDIGNIISRTLLSKSHLNRCRNATLGDSFKFCNFVDLWNPEDSNKSCAVESTGVDPFASLTIPVTSRNISNEGIHHTPTISRDFSETGNDKLMQGVKRTVGIQHGNPLFNPRVCHRKHFKLRDMSISPARPLLAVLNLADGMARLSKFIFKCDYFCQFKLRSIDHSIWFSVVDSNFLDCLNHAMSVSNAKIVNKRKSENFRSCMSSTPFCGIPAVVINYKLSKLLKEFGEFERLDNFEESYFYHAHSDYNRNILCDYTICTGGCDDLILSRLKIDLFKSLHQTSLLGLDVNRIVPGVSWKLDKMLTDFKDMEASITAKSIDIQNVEFAEDPEIEVTSDNYVVTIYYPESFHMMRHLSCGDDLNFIRSLCRTNRVQTSAGKSGAPIFVTYDGRFMIKLINKHEMALFVGEGTKFFNHFLSGTLISIPYGLYKIHHTKTNTSINCFIMQNIDSHSNSHKISFDIKGISFKRFVEVDSTNTNNLVLLDQNFKNYTKGCPLQLNTTSIKHILITIKRDIDFLAKLNIVDYSLLLHIFPNDGKITIGLIDFLRPYTWDKQIETIGKKLANIASGQAPTIISPNEYKTRFLRFIEKIFIHPLKIVQEDSKIGFGGSKRILQRLRCQCKICTTLDHLYSNSFIYSLKHYHSLTSPTAKRYIKYLLDSYKVDSDKHDIGQIIQDTYKTPTLII